MCKIIIIIYREHRARKTVLEHYFIKNIQYKNPNPKELYSQNTILNQCEMMLLNGIIS